jgi:four helix bundle protein
MRDFREVKVWTKSHALTLRLYKLTKSFPKDELYGLTAQIRRSAASIGANIAEGCGRRTRADFARFLQIALGSACELQYHLLLAADLEYMTRPDHEQVDGMTAEVKRMLTGFVRKLMADG